MKEFNIPIEYCKTIIIRDEWNTYTKNGRIPTPEELLLIMAGKGQCSITSNEDHPEFNKLRRQLSDEGYIHIEPGWWNGDRVLKSFMLNGVKFETGAQFPSAGAITFKLDRLKRYK